MASLMLFMNCDIYSDLNCVSRLNILFVYFYFELLFVSLFINMEKIIEYTDFCPSYLMISLWQNRANWYKSCTNFTLLHRELCIGFPILVRKHSLLYQLLMLCNRKHWESSFSCVVLALSQNEVLQLLVHSNGASSVSADLCKQSRPFRLL